MTCSYLLLAGVSALALMSAGARADEAIALEPITVQGTEDPTGPVAGYAAGTSASVKSDRSLLEIPGSVSIVTRDQIKDTGATNLSEALNYSPGVVTEAYGADPRYDSISVRGQDLQNELYLNGLRLRRSADPDYGAPSLDLYGMERVELLRGPQSVLYGAGSSAGLVNMVQKRAQMSGDTTETGADTDSNGSYHLFGDFNRVVSDRAAYRLVTRVGDGKLGLHQYDNKGGYLGLSGHYELTPSTTVELLGSIQKDDPDSPSGVPTSYVGTYSLRDLRDFYFGNEALESGDRQTVNLSAQITHELDNGWKVIANAGTTKFDWDYSNLSIASVTGTSVGRTLLNEDEDSSSVAADLRLTGGAQTGAVNHQLTFGIDASRFKEDTTGTFYYGQSAIDYASPDYSPLAPDYDGSVYSWHKKATVRQTGIYASDDMKYGNWRASLALRHDRNISDGQQTTAYYIPGSGTTDGYTDLDRDDDATTGQASISYVWNNGVSAYLSYGTSFSVFAAPDSNGDPLKPTKGKQWEMGVKYLPAASDIYLSAAIYRLDETNRATTTTVNNVATYSQIGKSRINGLELEARADLLDNWSLTGGYSYTDSEIRGGDLNGNELGLTPHNTFKLWASKKIVAGPLAGLRLGGGVRYIGSRYAFKANNYKLDGVTLLDAGATYDFGENTRLRLNVTNLTDRAYVSSVGYYSTYIGDGRTVSLELTHRW